MMLNDFIVEGLISGEFTKEQKIEYTTNYLSKSHITEEEAKRVIETLFTLEYTEDDEVVIPDELAELQDDVIANAEELRRQRQSLQKADLTKLNTVLKTTSLSLSELIMTLVMKGIL